MPAAGGAAIRKRVRPYAALCPTRRQGGGDDVPRADDLTDRESEEAERGEEEESNHSEL